MCGAEAVSAAVRARDYDRCLRSHESRGEEGAWGGGGSVGGGSVSITAPRRLARRALESREARVSLSQFIVFVVNSNSVV